MLPLITSLHLLISPALDVSGVYSNHTRCDPEHVDWFDDNAIFIKPILVFDETNRITVGWLHRGSFAHSSAFFICPDDPDQRRFYVDGVHDGSNVYHDHFTFFIDLNWETHKDFFQ